MLDQRKLEKSKEATGVHLFLPALGCGCAVTTVSSSFPGHFPVIMDYT